MTKVPNAIETESQIDVENEVQNDEIEDGHEATEEVNALSHEVVGEQVHDTTEQLAIPLRRSTRNRGPFTRYPLDEYVLRTDGGEPEDFLEAVEIKRRMNRSKK